MGHREEGESRSDRARAACPATRNGEIDLERPVGLLQKKDTLPGSDPQYEVILLHQQTPAQRQQVRQLQRAAVQNWWRAGHVGWAIFPVNSEYLQSDTKGESDAAEEQDQATSMGQYGAMANQVGADGRALAPSPFADIAQETVSLTPNCAATASASGLQITSAQQISKIGSFSSAQGGEPHSSGQMLGMNSGSGQHLGAVEGRNEPFYDIPSSEFLQATNNILSAQDSAAALSLSQFPSAGAYQGGDGTGRSGSLRWQMDQLRGMDSLDFGGSGIDISKLESIELPQELAAYANFSPADANLGNGMGGSGFGNALFGQGSDLVRQSSGLESMQSIEHALPSVPPSTSANYTDILEAAARDFNQSQQSSQHGGGASG
uniref:Uncharacterized protein n=1 Tax=Tetraselmis sp. GSL018 TaxID=582737 RepID=A0A061QPJ5_9CHLO